MTTTTNARLTTEDDITAEVLKRIEGTPDPRLRQIMRSLVTHLHAFVKEVQLTYAVMGALFMPLLALTLLVMNNRRDWVGARFCNGWLINGLLVATLLLIAAFGILQLVGFVPKTGA